MDKIHALNSISVVDWSCSGGECEYILAELTEENIKALTDAGFTTAEIDEAMGDDRENIDLSTLAFSYADAAWWNKNDGFSQAQIQ